MTFGEYIKAKRCEKRITLRAFSESLGYDPANYSRMERGLAMPPATDKLAAFARELEMSQASEEFKEMVRLAALGRGSIPPAILSDESVVAQLPILFRTLEGGKVDSAMLEGLFEAMKKE